MIKNEKKITEELDKADAHPYSSRPFVRNNYIKKFLTLTKNIISKKESDKFLKSVQNLKKGSFQFDNVEKKNMAAKFILNVMNARI